MKQFQVCFNSGLLNSLWMFSVAPSECFVMPRDKNIGKGHWPASQQLPGSLDSPDWSSTFPFLMLQFWICSHHVYGWIIDQLLKVLPGILDSPAGWSSTSPWCTFPSNCCLSKLSSSLDVLHLTGITLAWVKLTGITLACYQIELMWFVAKPSLLPSAQVTFNLHIVARHDDQHRSTLEWGWFINTLKWGWFIHNS